MMRVSINNGQVGAASIKPPENAMRSGESPLSHYPASKTNSDNAIKRKGFYTAIHSINHLTLALT